MSTKGIYTAVSGAIAQSQRLDTIANNIANANTTGFKKQDQVFNEYLTANEKPPDVIQVPRVPASIESFYDTQGGDKSYVNTSGTYTDFAQGAMRPTGNDLDLGLEGVGFFEVLTPQGVRLTRNGAFRIDSTGRLINQQGYPVLREGQGQDPTARIITIEQGQRATVSYEGDIFAAGNQVASLSIVEPNNKDALQKIGQSLYSVKPNYGEVLRDVASIKVHQGFLEASNVNIVNQMTEMIKATRTFESTQQAIKAFDQMNSKLVNEVAKIR